MDFLELVGPLVFVDTERLGFIDALHAFIGLHDIAIIALGRFLLISIRKVKHSLLRRIGNTVFAFLFIYILPDFSATFEAQREIYFAKLSGRIIDGFNLLYVWFKFPLYWIIGAILLFRTNPKTNNALQQRI